MIKGGGGCIEVMIAHTGIESIKYKQPFSEKEQDGVVLGSKDMEDV